MQVFIERTKESKDVQAQTVAELLTILDINPQTVLVTKNNALVPEQEPLMDEDQIKILSVISGG